jgi:hypothetical protein
VDTTPPVLANCPAPTLNLGCNPASIPTCATYTVTATDDCGVTPIVACTNVTVTNGCLRTRTLTYKATGGCGNTASCSQVITWTVDTVPPAFTNCPAATLNLGCNPGTIPDCDPAVGATDNCGVTNLSCARVDATNGCALTRTLTYTAVDGCNNSNTCSQVITWTVDTTAPVFTNCPGNINLGCNPASIPGCDPTVGASDNCGVTNIRAPQSQ